MRILTFDIETIHQPGATTFDISTQDITVVGIHDSQRDAYECYTVEELPELWKVIEQTDMLVGFNSDHFDIPVLNKYYPGDLTRIKSLDLLKEIYNILGRRVRLDAVAEGTFGARKSGDGLSAQKWWRAGEVQKVKDYCLKDVEITRKVFDYALEHGSLKYKELGKTKEVALDTSRWLEARDSAITHTLGL